MFKKIFKNLILILILIFPLVANANLSANPYYSKQGYLKDINYYEFITSESEGENIVVAVIDDGVWLQHPELSRNTWRNSYEINGNGKDDDHNGYIDDYYGWNFLDKNMDLTTKGAHGTGVAGIINAQDDGSGIVGLATEAKIMPLIVCDENGCPFSAVFEAIKYAVDNGADIINLSLGSTNGYVGYNSGYDSVIKYAYENDVVIVASAGNGDLESDQTIGQNLDFSKVSPVSNDVGGVNMVLGVGAFSNWSNYGSSVDAKVSGENILSLSVPTHDDGYYYKYWNGTSFSAPIISGAAALLKAKFPNLKNWEIIDRLSTKDLDLRELLNGDKKVCQIGQTNRKNVNDGGYVYFYGEHIEYGDGLRLVSDNMATNIDPYVEFIDASQFKVNTASLPSGTYRISDNNGACRIDEDAIFTVENNFSDTKKDNISEVDYNLVDTIEQTMNRERQRLDNIDQELTGKLKGKIILQVEEHGEAWYVYPKTGKRHYMANGEEAYKIMRYLGVGITNNDLNRVRADKNFAKKHSGKIFLQVENHGEAYYIDFEGNAHYLKNGEEAYNIMRDLGLGISNSDLSKIDID